MVQIVLPAKLANLLMLDEGYYERVVLPRRLEILPEGFDEEAHIRLTGLGIKRARTEEIYSLCYIRGAWRYVLEFSDDSSEDVLENAEVHIPNAKPTEMDIIEAKWEDRRRAAAGNSYRLQPDKESSKSVFGWRGGRADGNSTD